MAISPSCLGRLEGEDRKRRLADLSDHLPIKPARRLLAVTLKLALLQAHAPCNTIEDNIQRLGIAVQQAKAAGAQLLLAPELYLCGYGAGERLAAAALDADSPLPPALAALAQELPLVVGCALRQDGQIWNAALISLPGQAPRWYRKSHLYGDYEKAHFAAAKPPETVLFECAGLKIGVLICYDVEFPENVRRLSLAGADLVCVPTALPPVEFSKFVAHQIVPVRAFENQIHVAYANLQGFDGRFSYLGHSLIVAPDGQVLAQVQGAQDALLFAMIDPTGYEESRQANAYLRDLKAST